jgi:hypothetical protein
VEQVEPEHIHLPNAVLQASSYQTYTLVGLSEHFARYNRTVVIEFGCVPMPDQANAGPDQSAIPGNSATLNANHTFCGTGEWSVVSGTGGSFSNVNDLRLPLQEFLPVLYIVMGPSHDLW